MDVGHVDTDDRLLPRRCHAPLSGGTSFHEYVSILLAQLLPDSTFQSGP